jgi:hypothetical protein
LRPLVVASPGPASQSAPGRADHIYILGAPLILVFTGQATTGRPRFPNGRHRPELGPTGSGDPKPRTHRIYCIQFSARWNSASLRALAPTEPGVWGGRHLHLLEPRTPGSAACAPAGTGGPVASGLHAACHARETAIETDARTRQCRGVMRSAGTARSCSSRESWVCPVNGTAVSCDIDRCPIAGQPPAPIRATQLRADGHEPAPAGLCCSRGAMTRARAVNLQMPCAHCCVCRSATHHSPPGGVRLARRVDRRV